MAKFKLTALISSLCLVSVVFCGVVVSSQTHQPSVRLVTNPPISQVLPFKADTATPPSPVHFTLQAVDGVGEPLENASIRLQLLTPPKNPFFPTDFPVVEGTELLDIAAVASQGKLQFQQMLLIRGTYKLLVDVTPLTGNTFSPFRQTLTLSVPEHGVKYRNFGILAVILLLVGLGGGLVLGLKLRGNSVWQLRNQ